jgi:dTDP-4-dehydrorhamnose 3,5-epimerase
MNRITPLEVKDSFLVHGARFSDARGYFQEIYNESKFAEPITQSRWKQASVASSVADALRGLHCSNYAKYVTCVGGEVYDVVVDLRPESPTYLKWQGVWLDADDAQNPVHLYIPKRCGHGYYCKRAALLVYLQDGTYDPKEDIEVNAFDERFNIQWPSSISGKYIVSEKDRVNPTLAQVLTRLGEGKLGAQYREILPPSSLSALPPLSTKLLMYGHRGFLGGYFLEVLSKLPAAAKFDVVLGKARLENRQELADEIGHVRPDRIVCMAGIAGKPDISWCEKNPVETIRVNLVGQLNVLDVASAQKTGPVHCTILTSGGIYEYDEAHAVNSGRGFTEEDEPNFRKLFYYEMRIALERLLKSYPNALNLRIMYPTVSDVNNGKSLVSKLIKYQQIKSIPISISMLDDLWPVAVHMLQRGVLGTFNFNNPGTISHDQILQLYKEHVSPGHTWTSVPFDSSRPAAELSAAKLLSYGYQVPSVYESIKALMINASKTASGADIILPITVPSQLLADLKFGNSLNFKNILITGGAGFIGI